MRSTLQGGPAVKTFSTAGVFESTPASVRAALKERGFRLVREMQGDILAPERPKLGVPQGAKWFFASDDGGVQVTFFLGQDPPIAQIEYMGVNERRLRALRSYVATVLKPIPPPPPPAWEQGPVYMLDSNQMGGYVVRHMGHAGVPLQEGNYTPEVVQQIRHVREELMSDTPTGRLVVMTGPTGTGKSFLFYSLLTIPEVTFLLVDIEIFSQLTAPGLISALESHRGSGPLVVVVEDADDALVPRDGRNMELISKVLNRSDGLIAKLLDLRIILTSNAKHTDVDSALRRRMRLLEHLKVGPLPAEQATAVLRREMPDSTHVFETATALADVYGKAVDLGWKPPPRGRYGRPLRAQRALGYARMLPAAPMAGQLAESSDPVTYLTDAE